ncbi:beta-1,4-glucuronyltransferase 1-like [Osmia bicornis bicornis]|uniref:beta-1,4-glucuronyltransferase 1-like n=1 Tax=Osmia bicornis bicornis TaxID=1437191 RepID=UPI0010F4BB1A|nr:beta-1,4-glucuronyltransferase 1-like [Osmia bicornis bicornis]XP_029048406.1 beta-1,4-glucuronyltransferase 1-like [Osmia bicornis bicornis]XP_029048407.1 beta-1,4-glucuronyltransferase 1-like [Osmia bicornis bicornis]XP_029048408.1 beta-1,4-glucuronyltransferase 1-like [Osmia bicornis bicornis]XP_029048409.1 beta-1,4-glucuronyltransferase 1-like [Osmia bicornis bicornis]XP_029048410.1 beta-1,4-glucuronyltransferase 1-like [Osmia bicornis bicornis]XP_029048411.1 beta-1,4-glucuronyltransfe
MRCSGRKLLIWSSLTFLLIFVGRLLVNRVFYLPILMIGNDEILISNSHPNSERDTRYGRPTFVAGTYMAGQRPRNDSYCRWYHGLPRVLSYPGFAVIRRPEIGEKSPYRILPFVLRGTEERKKLPEVTLCTHATADQVYGIVELARRWEGPLSLAIFTPGLDAGIAITLLDRACRCEPEMYKVSIHLVFPADSPPLLRETARNHGDCAASDLQKGERETERNQKRMTYPINVARNVARIQANTTRVLVSDIELLPSEKLASGFMKLVRRRVPKTGIVFVVPVFEIESNQKPPSTKKELLLAIEAGRAVYFHRFLCSHCQKFPGLTRWLLRPDPGKVRPLIVTKREYPHNRWEPVFIGTRNDPLYMEEMSWEGRQDKMTQMFEMCLLNYRLVILDGAFLVHTPGIKRKTKRINMAKREFLRVQERKNAAIYQRVIKNLLKQYSINHKCS